jgi:multisubunit Na+/H+ antiporter MnhB subunit
MRSRSVLAGLVIFALGVITALLVLSHLVFEQAPVLPVLWFLAMLSGVGFAVLLFWLWLQSRRRRRSVRAAVADPRSDLAPPLL